MRYYTVAIHDSNKNKSIDDEWGEDDVIRKCTQHGKDFQVYGGTFDFDDDTGTPSSFEYEIIPL